MVERLVLDARWAATASIAVGAGGAMEILRRSTSHGELAGSGRAFQKQCMGQSVVVDHRSHAFLYGIMTKYIGKFHCSQGWEW
jgi:hypothetical protein